MFFSVNFVNINFIVNRFFRRAIRSKNIKILFFTKSSFSEEEIMRIISYVNI